MPLLVEVAISSSLQDSVSEVLETTKQSYVCWYVSWSVR